METVKLNNGIEMPILGFGVYQVTPEECERCVLDAISVGYRLIDTAQGYFNEENVGNAIVKCGVPRNELFITTKVWVTNAGDKAAEESINRSLRKLKTDYIDLMLIHQPINDYYGTWRAMQAAMKAGKIRAIGLSNFYAARYVDLTECSGIVPAVNQLETHVFYQQAEMGKLMKTYGTQLMAWAPFGEGIKPVFTNETLKGIASKYHKTVAQVVLRFLIQRGIVVIPKSTHKERMIENFNVFDFTLSNVDMNAIYALDENKTLFFSTNDPETVKMILNYAKEA